MNNHKNIIPIAFAFDDNLIIPAFICITSLLENANDNTFYDIHILHDKDTSINKQQFECLNQKYSNFNIETHSLDNPFNEGFEIRGISKAAYYRLLIPELITKYNKIIYTDVDIIFRTDLSNLYNTDISNYNIGACIDLGLTLDPECLEYIKSLNISEKSKYIQSGVLLINSYKLREANLTNKFKELSGHKLRYQDQDILNITCDKSIYFLPIKYNMTDNAFCHIINRNNKLLNIYSEEECKEGVDEGIIHYNGHKPWKSYCANFDIWWEYYRKSVIFDQEFYFNFFYSRIDDFDKLSLWKRIKILIRYFIIGRK